MNVLNIKFEHVLIVLSLIILTVCLHLFRQDREISEMLIVTLSNCMVFSITKYFEMKQRSIEMKNKNKDK